MQLDICKYVKVKAQYTIFDEISSPLSYSDIPWLKIDAAKT